MNLAFGTAIAKHAFSVCHHLIQGEYWDDITGKALDSEGVHKARTLEIEYIRGHNVYEKVPISQCWERTGKPPIAVQ